MEDVRSIISYRIDEVIERYYQNHVERVDLDFIAKVCYVLNCKVEDLLEYSNPDG